MSTDKERFEQLVRDHDEDPALAVARLRELWPDRLDHDDLPRATWLVNHLIGEKLGDWPQAYALLRVVDAADDRPALLRNCAVAAMLGGAPQSVAPFERRLAAAPGCTFAQAALVIRLGALQHQASTIPPAEGVQALLPCLAQMGSWPDFGPHGGLLAASLNNTVSELLERSESPVVDADYQRALNDGATLCRRAWGVAGTWVNHERADYLVALCANRTAQYLAALGAARAGLRLIETHGEQPIDRAFLLLEVAKACRGLGEGADAEAARAEAMFIAEGFRDPGLKSWFETRASE